ncbi:MAG: hypothetical protein GX902_08650 [Lentisphaerae bacterium]|jgi:hypothetical protein|nr:hypothetical protein [Lentisphaerota bacterium]
MNSTASETVSPYALSEGVQQVISVEGAEAEEVPATFSNIFALVGILLLANIILLLFIVLVCRCGKISQRHRRSAGNASESQ